MNCPDVSYISPKDNRSHINTFARELVKGFALFYFTVILGGGLLGFSGETAPQPPPYSLSLFQLAVNLASKAKFATSFYHLEIAKFNIKKLVSISETNIYL